MKKPGLKILIIFCLSFFISNHASALTGCNWAKANVIIVPGTTGSVWSCPDSNTKESASNADCSAKRPTINHMCCCSKATAPTTPAEPKFKLPDYKFQIPIGTLTNLKTVDCSEGTCNIPFLANYIQAIYKYGLSVAGVLGVLMLMAAGLLWLVSGGDSGKVGQAKKMIFGSVFGLLLLVGLSLFLSFINPDLAVTKILSLPSIKKIEIVPEQDTDITLVGGKTIYKAGCDAYKKSKDLSVCRAYGNLKPVEMSTVKGTKGNVQVDTAVYQKYLLAMECVKGKNGGKELFGINEGFRNAATQIKYWETLPKGQAAPPCCSNHGYGEAMDINPLDRKSSWAYNDSTGLTACMNAQGLKAELKSEPWHWSLTGR